MVKRQDKGVTPYNLRNCAYLEEFEKEKIVWQEIVREPSFALDMQGFYPEATAFFMTGENLKHLLTILNSYPAAYFFRQFYAGGGLGEEGYRYKKAFLEQIPIPKIPQQDQKPFEKLVDITISKKERGEDTTKEEQTIDTMVYKLYGLTYKEVKFIDSSFPLSEEQYNNFEWKKVEV